MTSKINDLWVEHLKSRPEWEPYFAFGFIEYDIGLIPGGLEKQVRVRKELLDSLNSFYSRFSTKTFIDSQSSSVLADDRLILKDSIIAVKLKEAIRIAEAEIEIFENELKYFVENNDLNKKKKRGRRFSMPQFFAFEGLVALKINKDDETGLAFVKSFFGPNGDLGNWILDMSKNEDLKYEFVDTLASHNVFDWYTKKRLILERIVLSRRKGFEIKSFVGFERDLEKLRSEVLESSKRLKVLSNM